FATDPDLAGARGQQTGQHAQQRGLAGTVAAMDQQRFAIAYMQRQRPEHALFVALESQCIGSQQRWCGGSHAGWLEPLRVERSWTSRAGRMLRVRAASVHEVWFIACGIDMPAQS